MKPNQTAKKLIKKMLRMLKKGQKKVILTVSQRARREHDIKNSLSIYDVKAVRLEDETVYLYVSDYMDADHIWARLHKLRPNTPKFWKNDDISGHIIKCLVWDLDYLIGIDYQEGISCGGGQCEI